MAITSKTRIDKRKALLAKLGLDPKTATAKAVSTALKNLFKNLTKLETYVCKAAAKGQDAGLCSEVELYSGQTVNHVSMNDVAKLQRAFKKLLGESLDLIRVNRSNLNIRSVAHIPRAITSKAVRFLRLNDYGDMVKQVTYTYKDKDTGVYKNVTADAVSSALFKLLPHVINREAGAVITELPDSHGVLVKVTVIDINKAHYQEVFRDDIEALRRDKGDKVRTMSGVELTLPPNYISLPMLQSLFAKQMPKSEADITNANPADQAEFRRLVEFNKHPPSARLIKKIKATNKELYTILQRAHLISLPKNVPREVSYEDFKRIYEEKKAEFESGQAGDLTHETLEAMYELIFLRDHVEPIVEQMYDTWLAKTLESRELSDQKRRAARARASAGGKPTSQFEKMMNHLRQWGFAQVDSSQSVSGIVAQLPQQA